MTTMTGRLCSVLRPFLPPLCLVLTPTYAHRAQHTIPFVVVIISLSLSTIVCALSSPDPPFVCAAVCLALFDFLPRRLREIIRTGPPFWHCHSAREMQGGFCRPQWKTQECRSAWVRSHRASTPWMSARTRTTLGTLPQCRCLPRVFALPPRARAARPAQSPESPLLYIASARWSPFITLPPHLCSFRILSLPSFLPCNRPSAPLQPTLRLQNPPPRLARRDTPHPSSQPISIQALPPYRLKTLSAISFVIRSPITL